MVPLFSNVHLESVLLPNGFLDDNELYCVMLEVPYHVEFTFYPFLLFFSSDSCSLDSQHCQK